MLKVDGHDPRDIEQKLIIARNAKKPTVIIADTVAGKGLPHIEHTLKAHYYVPTKEDIAHVTKKQKKI